MTIRSTIADRISGGQISELTAETERLSEQNSTHSKDLLVLRENMRRLEALLYSGEWRMLQIGGEQEFTREGINQIIKLARLMRLKNPVIQRGVEVQRLYVWAQGIKIDAADERIRATINAFQDDERNRAEFTTHQAKGEQEVNLQQDGNLFFRFFIDEQSGRIRLRTIDPLEIKEILCNPEDKKEPWFYKRKVTRKQLDGTVEQLIEYYPDWHYNPIARPILGEGDIDWSTPVYHVRVNASGAFGVPEFYAALDWALAYKSFLEQLAAVWSALARFAYKLTGMRSAAEIATQKVKLGTTLSTDTDETNPPPVMGSVALMREGRDLQPMRTAGATMKADDGRRLLLMAIQVFGFPETFYSDVSVGTLATAKSLDRPTELKIKDRQSLWKSIHSEILQFVLLWAVKAPRGALRTLGKVTKERDGEQYLETLVWKEGIDSKLIVDFPPIVEADIQQQVGALVDGVTLKGSAPAGTIPLKNAVRRLLTILGFDEIDQIMEEWEAEQEQPVEQAAQAFDQMAQAARQLEEALAQALNGGENSDN